MTENNIEEAQRVTGIIKGMQGGISLLPENALLMGRLSGEQRDISQISEVTV